MNTLQSQLNHMLQTSVSDIKSFCIQEILDTYRHDDDIRAYIHDVMTNGCLNGACPSLIYYEQTYAFYDRFYHEIEDVRMAYEKDTGECVALDGDLKTFFAWFAYEQTLMGIAQELGIEW